ncbi:MAG TPA: HAMP domain-containing sensor histidine kinase [Stenomitos sp.]
MSKRHHTSIAPPIIWGSILIAICLALITLWNVVIVTDYMHLRQLADAQAALGPGRWIILALGCVLFIGVLVGLILFLISLVKQIRHNRAQQNFIDSITHELKTPLTSLKLHLQTLERGRVPADKQGEFHRVMLQDVERLSSLLDHVLEAARLERHQPTQLNRVELRPLLEEVAGTVRARYDLAPEALRVDGPSPSVMAEGGALQVIFLNLLDNAVKYSGEAIDVQVEIEPRPTGGAIVRVRDHGVGIAPRELKKVFQRFYRVGNELTRVRPGTGLGLYIVRETIHAYGGRIAVDSRGEGLGTTFTVTLPGEQDG